MATQASCELLLTSKALKLNDYDALILPLSLKADAKPDKFDWSSALSSLDENQREAVIARADRAKWQAKSGSIYSFDLNPTLRLILWFEKESSKTFDLLGNARKLTETWKSQGIRKLAADLSHCKGKHELVDALVATLGAMEFELPHHKHKKPKPVERPESLTIKVDSKELDDLQKTAKHAQSLAAANNLARTLTIRAGNDLTPETFHQEAKALSKEWGASFEWMGMEKLREMKAGAFVAVAQGSDRQDAGIAKLSYKPKGKSAKKLALVGKGVTYDTGGINLKPAAYMYGMEGDMGGSAVALSLFQLAVQENWPVAVDCYLAIADNAISAKAYRPNDVVKSLSGKTIEVVHTDAEGRMLLADTLTLASQNKVDLIMDFATLTGACVGAIGDSYAGAFSNRRENFLPLIAAGEKAGERVWPFPLDDDFGECLDSDLADIKQCRLKGGVDHIEAAYFLKEFLVTDSEWVHVDLAASSHTGGLAHIPTEVTGFGVRFAAQFIADKFQF